MTEHSARRYNKQSNFFPFQSKQINSMTEHNWKHSVHQFSTEIAVGFSSRSNHETELSWKIFMVMLPLAFSESVCPGYDNECLLSHNNNFSRE